MLAVDDRGRLCELLQGAWAALTRSGRGWRPELQAATRWQNGASLQHT